MQSYCYRCKFWKRCEDDFIVGLCRNANAYRFQFEDCEIIAQEILDLIDLATKK